MESPFAPTKETANENRVSYCVKYVFTCVLRDIFRSKIPEGEFQKILKKEGESEKLKLLLDSNQMRLLYPRHGFKGYNDFDISLLFILIKTYCDLPAPENGWEGFLRKKDRSLSANIRRIKFEKNFYGSHNVHSVSDKTFETTWKEYDQILKEVLAELNDPKMNEKYANVIEFLRTVSLDPKSEANITKLEDEVGRLEKRQSELESRQKGVEIKIDYLEERHDELRIEQDSLENKFASLEQRLEDEGEKNIETTKKLTANLQKHMEKQKKDHSRINSQEKKLEEMGKQQGEMMTSLLYIREEGQEKFSKMEADQKTLNTKQRELENRIESTEIYQDKETKNIFENTKEYLQNHRSCKLYKKTSAVNETIKKLKEGHIAILTGKQGTGKTTTALQIMCEMSDESSESPVYKPALIKSPEQWDKAVNVSQRFIIYLDDFIGRTNFNSCEFENWKNQLDFICSCSKTWNVCVLLGLRQNILDEARLYSQHEILREEYEVNLSSKYKVTRKEKEEILTAYEKDYAERNVKDSTCGFPNYEREKIIDTDPFYGFPLTCSQFFSRPDFFNLGVSYFKQSDEMLRMAIEKMRKSTDNKKVFYCVLCYVLINGNIEKESIDVKKGILKEILQIFFKKKINGVANVDIKDAIDDLHRLYLSKKESKDKVTFSFSHKTVLEAVFISFREVQEAPKMMIKCKLLTLCELIRTQNNASKPNEVVLRIPKENYKDLAERLLGERNDALTFIAFHHPLFSDPEFVSVFFNSSGIKNETLSRFWELLKISYTSNCNLLLTELLNSYGPHYAQTVTTDDTNLGKCSPALYMRRYTEKKNATRFSISTDDINKLTRYEFSLGKCSRALCVLQYIEKHSSLHHLLNTRKNGLTPLQYCIERGWKDMVDKILTINTPRSTEMN